MANLDDPTFQANIRAFDKLLRRLDHGTIIKIISQPTHDAHVISEYWVENTGDVDLIGAKRDLDIVLQAAKSAGALVHADLADVDHGLVSRKFGDTFLSEEAMMFDINFTKPGLKEAFDAATRTLEAKEVVDRSQSWVRSVASQIPNVSGRVNKTFEQLWFSDRQKTA